MPENAAMGQKGPQSEDCLNLDIYTPAVGANSGKRPVMVWYHGGRFVNGSGGASCYDGANMARKQDVVVVTVTHRLNIFGFLYLEELFGPAYADSGNVGILDCVEALRWVRDNIAEFGGDPNLVTAFGQSGGGGKVSTMMGMPAAHGLFKRAISESSAALRSLTKDVTAKQAKAVVDRLGARTIADMQAAPAEKLLEAMNALRFRSGPMLDGRNIPEHPFGPKPSPISADVPMLMGNTETEITFVNGTPTEPMDDAQFRQHVKDLFHCEDADADQMIQLFRGRYPGRDNTWLYQMIGSQASNFQTSTYTQAERKADQMGAPIWYYYFVHTVPARGGKIHAPHTGEIPYVFDSLAHSKPMVGPITPREQQVADIMSTTWATFARTGNPNNPKIPDWPAFDTRRRATLLIDNQCKVVDDPLGPTRAAIAALQAKGRRAPAEG
jgi:para-nitrobenzyl esterase